MMSLIPIRFQNIIKKLKTIEELPKAIYKTTNYEHKIAKTIRNAETMSKQLKTISTLPKKYVRTTENDINISKNEVKTIKTVVKNTVKNFRNQKSELPKTMLILRGKTKKNQNG